MFKPEFQKDAFLEQKKAARECRAQEKRKETAALKIQSVFRGWIQRKKYINYIL